jgi:hypothetical protein
MNSRSSPLVSTLLVMLFTVSLTAVEIVHAPPSFAAACLADGLRPYPSAGKDVTFPGRGECSGPVNGIRVHIDGWRKTLDHLNATKILNNHTRICGGVTHQTNIFYCPISTYYESPEANRASGCKYYWSKVWIDVAFAGQPFWSLNVDSLNPGTSLICYSDPP